MSSTGNPIGQPDARDTYLNASNLDKAVNSEEENFTDRLGKNRLTLKGMENLADNLKDDIQEFSGVLAEQSKWEGVPKHSGQDLGGDNGALNKQAQILANRTNQLNAQSRESLRRSYEEAGLNMVVGSFEKGGVLANANDVLLHESSGKVYSGPVGIVIAGTNPLTGSFVDESKSLLRTSLKADLIYYEIPEIDSFTRTVLERLSESMSIKDFWHPVDLDWTNAFNRASLASKESGKVCHIPPGEYDVTNSILLWDAQVTGTQEAGQGQYYATKGTRFVGDGREARIIKTAKSTENVNAVFYAKGRRSITVSGVSIFDQTENSVGYYTAVSCVQLHLSDIFIQTRHLGLWINSNAFVGVRIEDIVIEGSADNPINYGVRIKSGTSYCLNRIHVDKCAQDGYELGGAYLNIGVLSCDNCRGIPYVFTGFFGSIQSLGVEMLDGGAQNSTSFLFRNGGLCTIGEIHLIQKEIKTGGFLFDLSSSQVKVNKMYISDSTITNGAIAKLRSSALLDIGYATLYKIKEFKEPISYDQATVTECSIGTLAGTQYRQAHDITTFHNLTLPTDQPTTEDSYRIFGWAGNDVGCVGTLTSIRGRGLNTISTLVMDVAFVAGNNGGSSARAVKRAVSDTAGLNSYTGWYQGIVDGRNYYMIKMDAVGTRNLGSFFNGAVIGKDPNLFRVVTASQVTNLQPNPGGATMKTETAA